MCSKCPLGGPYCRLYAACLGVPATLAGTPKQLLRCPLAGLGKRKRIDCGTAAAPGSELVNPCDPVLHHEYGTHLHLVTIGLGPHITEAAHRVMGVGLVPLDHEMIWTARQHVSRARLAIRFAMPVRSFLYP
jgi:hypothetical protein